MTKKIKGVKRKIITKSEYKKRFNHLYRQFSDLVRVFYTWKGLQKKEFEDIFQKNADFWIATLNSLEHTWLSLLAKIYENSTHTEDNTTISVYSLVKDQKDKDRAKKVKGILYRKKEIISNIKKLRNKHLFHNDAKFLFNPKKILKKYPIKYKEIEQLIKRTDRILENLSPNKDCGFLLLSVSDGYIGDSEDLVSRKIKYFLEKLSEHIEKFSRGEVDNVSFPPSEKNGN